MITEDFSDFTDTDALGTAATWKGTTTVNGIFGNDFYAAESLGVGVDGSQPQFACAESDVSGVARGQALSVSGTSYTIIDIQPDGTGWVVLILQES